MLFNGTDPPHGEFTVGRDAPNMLRAIRAEVSERIMAVQQRPDLQRPRARTDRKQFGTGDVGGICCDANSN